MFYFYFVFLFLLVNFIFGIIFCDKPRAQALSPLGLCLLGPFWAYFTAQFRPILQANRSNRGSLGLPSSLHSQRIDQAHEHQPARPSASGLAHTNRRISLFLSSPSCDHCMHPSQPATDTTPTHPLALYRSTSRLCTTCSCTTPTSSPRPNQCTTQWISPWSSHSLRMASSCKPPTCSSMGTSCFSMHAQQLMSALHPSMQPPSTSKLQSRIRPLRLSLHQHTFRPASFSSKRPTSNASVQQLTLLVPLHVHTLE